LRNDTGCALKILSSKGFERGCVNFGEVRILKIFAGISGCEEGYKRERTKEKEQKRKNERERTKEKE